MIRSGEGRGGGWPGGGREGREREGEGGRGVGQACKRAPAASPAAWPRPAPAPTAGRGARAASAPAPPEPRASASCARSPARAGGGGRALRPRGDPGSPPPRARPGGSHLHSKGARPRREGRPAAHVRVFKLFLEGLACPPRRKMPTEAVAGGGEEAASAFQTSQEFRTLRPNPGCPCG